LGISECNTTNQATQQVELGKGVKISRIIRRRAIFNDYHGEGSYSFQYII
jgi:hypothetical protein